MSKQQTVDLATTLHVRDTCLCFAVRRAARALSRRFDEAFRPLGITNGQFSLMMSLNRPDSPRMSDIADFLAMDRTTLTAALKPLEKSGFISVRPDERDRRNRRLSLTDAGREILARAVPIWRETHGEVDRLVRASDPQGFRADLKALA
ncbi:MarR family transcriptional regulator [Chelativorans sp. ZYF759]|uniref:MarR family transcriptional regulator n=1 Tax=Chelativorans sp. ZYF759 TaxID=2692213 RepID=UPI00145D3BFB|nr:MarR family transcriptional regulator [Chelativorans sp. ZYF759]NMG40164.1 MarR family transcriptional regulator [Chelativorans sp. ZYF759]